LAPSDISSVCYFSNPDRGLSPLGRGIRNRCRSAVHAGHVSVFAQNKKAKYRTGEVGFDRFLLSIPFLLHRIRSHVSSALRRGARASFRRVQRASILHTETSVSWKPSSGSMKLWHSCLPAKSCRSEFEAKPVVKRASRLRAHRQQSQNPISAGVSGSAVKNFHGYLTDLLQF
jgi:hypothetical protein